MYAWWMTGQLCSQQEGSSSKPGCTQAHGVCIFSMCAHGMSLRTLVSFHSPKNMDVQVNWRLLVMALTT